LATPSENFSAIKKAIPWTGTHSFTAEYKNAGYSYNDGAIGVVNDQCDFEGKD